MLTGTYGVMVIFIYNTAETAIAPSVTFPHDTAQDLELNNRIQLQEEQKQDEVSTRVTLNECM